MNFSNGDYTCSEALGPKECSSGFRLWNLEGNARVYDDAANWTGVVTDQYNYRGKYRDANNALQPFNCPSPGGPDGPRSSFLQKPAGQKSIFYLDAPGPYYGITPSMPCNIGTSVIDSETDVLNFQVTFTSTVTGYKRPVYYYVKIIVTGGHLDMTNSTANYGNLSLNF